VELHAEPVNGVYQIVHISQRGDGAQSHALPEFSLAVNDILGWHGAPHRKKKSAKHHPLTFSLNHKRITGQSPREQRGGGHLCVAGRFIGGERVNAFEIFCGVHRFDFIGRG
jgi:hypothetical protein